MPTAFVSEGTILIVLKSYFDCSGKDEAPFITLSGIATNDDLWAEIDTTWDYLLKVGTPKAEYMHMVEAVHLRDEFDRVKGWDDDKVFQLINALLSYITQLDKSKYCQFSCTVDMNAYRKLLGEGYQMDSPTDICNKFCVETVMQWYLLEYKGLCLEAHYYFDQGEPFEPLFKAKWERETELDKLTGNYTTIWSHIKHVGTSPMRSTVGLQVADMLAWGRNREETKANRYQHLALALTRLAPSKWVVFDEALLRRKYRPLLYKP